MPDTPLSWTGLVGRLFHSKLDSYSDYFAYGPLQKVKRAKKGPQATSEEERQAYIRVHIYIGTCLCMSALHMHIYVYV